MSTSWYLMSTTGYTSGYEADEFTSDAQNGFAEILQSFVGKSVTVYGDKITSGTTTRVVIQNLSPDSPDAAITRTILFPVGGAANKYYVKDTSRNEYWLINSPPADNGMYEKVSAWYCNYQLKFISPLTGIVVEYPIHEKRGTSIVGEKGTDVITIGGSNKIIYLPYNDETKLIDNESRFLIDKNNQKPIAYRVTNANRVVYSTGTGGLIQLTLEETQRNDATDNCYLMIADYYDTSDIYAVSITNATTPLLLEPEGTFQLTYSATKNSVAVDQTDVSFISSDDAVATVSATGLVTAVDAGSCVITARYEKATAVLSVDVDEAAQAAEIHIVNSDGITAIAYGVSKTFGVEIFENGVPSNEEFTATVAGVDGIIATVVNDTVVVAVPDNETLIDSQFVLTVSCATLAVSSTLNLTVRGWF